MPAPLKAKGDLAEAVVAADILRRGHKIAYPFGEDWDYDLIALRHGRLERVQVKHATSDGDVIHVRCRSHSLTGGRVRQVKHYTAETVDWIAVFDPVSDRCYYVPSSRFDGHSLLTLRLTAPRNGQGAGINLAANFLAF